MSLDAVSYGQGMGSRLVEAGLEACRNNGHKIVVVLGHPEFYPRFGFSADLARPLTSLLGGGEAWTAMELVPGALLLVSDMPMTPEGVKTDESDTTVTANFAALHLLLRPQR